MLSVIQEDLVAWVALVFSGLSILVAIWSAFVSHKSLRHSKDSYKDKQEIAFERERSEFLEHINDDRRRFEAAQHAIEELKTEFEALPDGARMKLGDLSLVFIEYLPTIQGFTRQANSLWYEVAEWKKSTGIYALVHHQPQFKTLLRNDRMVHDEWIPHIEKLKKELQEMKVKYV